MIARTAGVLAIGIAAAACAPAKSDAPLAIIPMPMDMDCGFNASKDLRRTREERENPPACALPDAKALAQSCAIHDLIRAPGYRPDEEDEIGAVRNPTPLPAYRVTDLVCAFDGEGRNRATCRFALTVPGAAPAQTMVRLRHKNSVHITPLTTEYWVMWQLDDDCTPDVSPAS